MTIHVGLSLCRRVHQLHDLSYHLPSLFFPPILDLPLSLSRHLPSLVPGCNRFQIHCPYFSVIVPFLLACFLQWIGPAPPTGCSSIYLSQKLHTCPHSWQRPLSCGGLIAANGGEDEVNWEPRLSLPNIK